MDWIIAFSERVKTSFDNAGLTPMAFPLAFLLGLASAAASACCTLPVFGAIVGYAGTQKAADRKANLISALSFMVGTVIALLIIGSVAGFIGQVAQSILGKYWKLFAGIAAIIVGLGALNLLPFKLPQKKTDTIIMRTGLLQTVLFGLVMGGAVSICSLACNPGIFIILGVAVLQGYTLWMFGILILYAIGFSLPLTALMLGVSFGKSAIRFKKADTVIRLVAGVVLIVVGFYFLYTF
jgi:cytochrome c biogenesis protein CcdA